MQSSYLTGQTLTIINDYRTAQFCTLAAAVVLVYDTLLTLGHEVRYIWSRRLGVMSVLYLVNRYVEIASYIPAVVPLTPKSDAVRGINFIAPCRVYSKGLFSSMVLMMPPHYSPISHGQSRPFAKIDILALVFSGIRVYALAGRRMYLAFIVFILNATFIIPDIYVYSKLRLPQCAAGPLQARELTPCYHHVPYQFILTLKHLSACAISRMHPHRRSYSDRGDYQVHTQAKITFICITCFRPSLSIPLILNVLITVLIANGSDAIDVARMGLTTFRDSLTSIFISRFFLELAQLAATQSASTAIPGEAESSVLTTHFSSDFSGVTYTLELDRFSGDFDDHVDHAGVRYRGVTARSIVVDVGLIWQWQRVGWVTTTPVVGHEVAVMPTQTLCDGQRMGERWMVFNDVDPSATVRSCQSGNAENQVGTVIRNADGYALTSAASWEWHGSGGGSDPLGHWLRYHMLYSGCGKKPALVTGDDRRGLYISLAVVALVCHHYLPNPAITIYPHQRRQRELYTIAAAGTLEFHSLSIILAHLSAVILVYDAIITCEDEVRYIWRRRFDITTALYIVNKYVEMAACICGLVLLFPVSTEMYDVFQVLSVDHISTNLLTPPLDRLGIFLSLSVVFSGIRVYALTGRKKLLATVVFTLSLMFIVPNLYLLSRANFDIFNQYPYPSNCGGLAIRVGASSSTLIPCMLAALCVMVVYSYQ
ncbi:hypothetical protein C8Q74DRAFT_1222326 [Fomes fomentarius]|nr:hypothetical protein C8Q74DRAFT_1222326 [Fomes fomentarius]